MKVKNKLQNANKLNLQRLIGRVGGLVFTFYFLLLTCFAQSGGQFSISHSVIANGGGQSSTGGTFNVSGTVGQPAVGIVPGGTPFLIRNGFWHPGLAPTAAGISIAGRVLTPDGRGLSNALVTVTDMNGSTRTARSTSFGYYRFEDIEAGQSIVLAVSSRNYQFEPLYLSVFEDLFDLDLVSYGQISR